MKIQFKELEIQNFKAIEHKIIQLSNETMLKGMNGSGKTTVADAIYFVLFNKDFEGNSSTVAGFKPVDTQGNEIHDLTTSVKLTLDIDGVTKIVERKQLEKWTTKRGTSTKIFEGNLQVLYINESEVKAKEFTSYIDEIIKEDMFRLLTNPHYFMENIDQKKRRELLMEFIGDEELGIDQELKAKLDYVPLLNEWNTDLNKDKDFNGFVDWLKQKSKTDNETLKMLPFNIEELEKSIGEEVDVKMQNEIIETNQKNIEKVDEEIAQPSAEVPAWVDEAKAEANKLVEEANEIVRKKYEEANKSQSDTLVAKSQFNTEIDSIRRNISNATVEIRNLEGERDHKAELKNKKLADYREIKAKELVVTEQSIHTCYACGQELPKEKQTIVDVEARMKELEAERQAKLDVIIKEGTKLGEEIEQISTDIANLEIKKRDFEEKEKEVATKLNSLPETKTYTYADFENEEEVVSKKNKADELRNKVKEAIESLEKKDLQPLFDQKKVYSETIAEAHKKIGKVEQQENTRKQIADLRKKEEELRDLKTHFEVLLNLADDFQRDKNMMFEQRLSNHFTKIKWQLFEQQVNGGYKQVCEPLLNGRSWGRQSLGEKITVGVDIIKTFQSKYDIQAPIIIDNRESLTLPLDVEVQTISMYVDETINELTIL